MEGLSENATSTEMKVAFCDSPSCPFDGGTYFSILQNAAEYPGSVLPPPKS